MGHIVADSVLLERLTGFVEPVEIWDAEGKVVGLFTPGRQTEELTEAEVRKFFDPEEMKRRKLAERGKGLTTQEVLARLHALKENGK
jgi:hypothetical protein